MGIGDHPCGVGPCGFAPVGAPTVRSTATAAIPYYDPAIRGLPILANGDLATAHPVIQEASLAIGVVLGSIPAAPTVGLNVKRILQARREDVPQVATDEVNVALKRLIDAGDVRVIRVTAIAYPTRVAMDTEIANLRDPASRPVILRSSFNGG